MKKNIIIALLAAPYVAYFGLTGYWGYKTDHNLWIPEGKAVYLTKEEVVLDPAEHPHFTCPDGLLNEADSHGEGVYMDERLNTYFCKYVDIKEANGSNSANTGDNS